MHTPKRLRAPLLSGTVTIWASRSHVRSNIAEAVFSFSLCLLSSSLWSPFTMIIWPTASLFLFHSHIRLWYTLMSVQVCVAIDQYSQTLYRTPSWPATRFPYLHCDVSPTRNLHRRYYKSLHSGTFPGFSVPKVAGPTRLIYAVNSRGPI